MKNGFIKSGNCQTVLLLVFLLQLSVICRGQGAIFGHYTDKDGLAHNSLRQIVQDENGYLWLATFGGVCRFDGISFKTYSSGSKESYLPNDDVTGLVYDSVRNSLWIGTDDGLVQLNTENDSVKLFNTGSALQSNDIRTLYMDTRNNLWIGTKSSGIYVYSAQGNFHHIYTSEISYIKTIHRDTKGRLWIGSTSSGIAKIEFGENFKIKHYAVYQDSLNFYPDKQAPLVYFFHESEGKIYAGTRIGLFRFDEELNDFQLLKPLGQKEENDFRDYYRCITRSSDGSVWVGTYAGIFKARHIENILAHNYDHFYHEERYQNSLTNNLIADIFQDRSGVIWVATENGLDKYDPYINQFRTINNELFYKLKTNATTCFSETFDNKLIIGNILNGIILKDKDNYSHILDEDIQVSSITSADGIHFWIGTWKGELVYYNYRNNTFKKYKSGLYNTPFISLHHITENEILIGTNGNGLIVFNRKTEQFSSSDDLIDYDFPKNINLIVKSSDDGYWIGTDDGLLRLDPGNKSVIQFTAGTKSGKNLSHNSIKAITEDKNRNIWVATRQGICKIPYSREGHFDIVQEEGLEQEWATDIAIDRENNVWFNINNNKLIRYIPEEKKITRFSIHNGIRSNIHSKRGFYYWNDSLIFVGGIYEIMYFNPSGLKVFKATAQPTLSELKINNKIVKTGSRVNGQVVLNREIPYSKEISLKNKNNNFSIAFFSSNYVNLNDRKYRYQLKPFENEWIELNRKHTPVVQYTNVFSGKYEFMVCSKNADGEWSEPTILNIKVAPPFWISYIALVLYILFITGIVFFWRRFTVNRLALKNELLLEKVKREKEEKLLQEKLRFFTNISHELKTPLTLILGPAKQLLSFMSNPELQERHNLIFQNATRLLTLVNQLLDFRKAEAGTLKLKVSETDILNYTRNIFRLFKPMAEEKSIQYEFGSGVTDIRGWIDRDKYDKILYNLLSNAFKYTRSKGKISVSLVVPDGKPEFVRISVKDNGKGIPKEYTEKIFQRFYQIPDKEFSNTGTGIGLSLVKTLVSVHKGEIRLESEPEKGTRFIFEIPVNRNFYEEHEIFAFQERKPKLPEFTSQEISVKPGVNTHPKLLIIEDNSELRNFILSIFSSSYYVIEAADGLEGLKQARENQPEIVIADVMMERMDGFEFCRELKTDSEISHIPVVLLTALGTDLNRKIGYRLGADDYISKPFDPSLLKVRIDSLINNRNRLKDKYHNDTNVNLHILSNSAADDNLLEKMQGIIEENLSNPSLKLKFLCEQLNMSQSKLYKKLGAISSLTPNEFIQTFRLKHAAQLLKNKELSVSEIAYSVGFNDPLYFSKCFRKQFNVSPTDYRKN